VSVSVGPSEQGAGPALVSVARGEDGQPPVGFYGKLPARGDFVTRRLPGPFVEAWDAWLQAGIAESRTMLGERWLQAWLEGPIWRFVLAPGAAGPLAVAGVMMPSVDQAGRYFPLTLATCLAEEPSLLACAANDAWFVTLENAALGALAPNSDMATFEAQVTGIGAIAAGRAPETAPWGEGGMKIYVDDGAGPLAALAGAYPSAAFAGRCLFWTGGAQRVAPAVLLLPALPTAAQFAALLDDVATPPDLFGGPPPLPT
jgi:type VI secretion system protein ImpM